MAPGNARGTRPPGESPGPAVSRDVKTDPLLDFGESRPMPAMEDLEVTKTISLGQSGSLPNQPAVNIPAAGSATIWLNARAAKSSALCLIFCIVFNFWINSERARALIAQSSPSLAAGPRIASDRGFASGHSENLPVTTAHSLSGGNGILENLGVVLFVSGLSPYLQQESPQQRGLPNPCASPQESRECRLAREQRWFSLYLQIFASVLLCGLISWGDVVWMDRR